MLFVCPERLNAAGSGDGSLCGALSLKRLSARACGESPNSIFFIEIDVSLSSPVICDF